MSGEPCDIVVASCAPSDDIGSRVCAKAWRALRRAPRPRRPARGRARTRDGEDRQEDEGRRCVGTPRRARSALQHRAQREPAGAREGGVADSRTGQGRGFGVTLQC